MSTRNFWTETRAGANTSLHVGCGMRQCEAHDFADLGYVCCAPWSFRPPTSDHKRRRKYGKLFRSFMYTVLYFLVRDMSAHLPYHFHRCLSPLTYWELRPVMVPR